MEYHYDNSIQLTLNYSLTKYLENISQGASSKEKPQEEDNDNSHSKEMLHMVDQFAWAENRAYQGIVVVSLNVPFHSQNAKIAPSF